MALKTPALNAAELPGGAGTVSGSTLNVPSGAPDYSGWDFTGYTVKFSVSTTATFTDCSFKVGSSQILVDFTVGGITVNTTFNWCTADGTGRATVFAGGFYVNASATINLTITNSSYPNDSANNMIVRAGGAQGDITVTDSYIGTWYNFPSDTEGHAEICHDFATGSGNITFQRNMCDARLSHPGGNATAYQFAENGGASTVNWLCEDNIFLGFDDAGGTLTAANAIQVSGAGGSRTYNNNVFQLGSGKTFFARVGGSSNTTGTGNRRWSDGAKIAETSAGVSITAGSGAATGDPVVLNGLSNVYEQRPGGTNEKGNRLTSGDVVMTAAQGSYALTGRSVAFKRSISAVRGTYTLSGQDVALSRTIAMKVRFRHRKH